MSNIGSFNANEVPPTMGFAPKPKGRYQVHISESELKPNNEGTSKMLNFVCPINGGAYHGQDIIFNLTWEHSNPKAVAMGKGQFSTLCHATGVLHPMDTVQLHNIPFFIDVDITPDGKYQQVVNFERIGGAAPVAAAPAPVALPQPIQQAPAPIQAAPAPVQLPPPPVAVAPAPVATFPPAGWLQHPQNPAFYYEAANPANIKDAATLQALSNALPGVTSVTGIVPAPMGNGAPDWVNNQLA